MRNSDLNNKPFFVKTKEGSIYGQAALSTTGPYIYTNGLSHIVINEDQWDDYAPASDDLGVMGVSLSGGMVVNYSASDLAEALNDVTIKLDLLRRRMMVPIKVLSMEEFMTVMNTPDGLVHYANLTLDQADGHLGIFREEIDRGQITTHEEGGVQMPITVYGSVMLYTTVLDERMEIINDDRKALMLTPAMNEDDIVMFVVYRDLEADEVPPEEPASERDSESDSE